MTTEHKPHSELVEQVRDAFTKADWDGYWLDDGSQPITAFRDLGLDALRSLEEQNEALVGVAGGVIWLANNLHNYGSDDWRRFFEAVLEDARAAYPASTPHASWLKKYADLLRAQNQDTERT